MNHRASPVWVARARDWPADTRSNVYSNRLGRFHLPSCSRARLEQCRLIWSRVTRRRAMSARSGPPVVVDQRDDRCETRATRVIVITRVSYYATKRIGGKTIRERDTEGREARRGERGKTCEAKRGEKGGENSRLARNGTRHGLPRRHCTRVFFYLYSMLCASLTSGTEVVSTSRRWRNIGERRGARGT